MMNWRHPEAELGSELHEEHDLYDSHEDQVSGQVFKSASRSDHEYEKAHH